MTGRAPATADRPESRIVVETTTPAGGRHSARLQAGLDPQATAAPTRASPGRPALGCTCTGELHIDGHYLGIGLSGADIRAVYIALFADSGGTQT